MSDWSTGTCPHAGDCDFYRSVSASAVLRIKYATMYPYCKKSRHESCMRYWLLERGKPVPTDLLPDGGKDAFVDQGGRHRSDEPRRVLVVDDMPMFRAALVTLVRGAGSTVSIVEADSAEKAFGELSADPEGWVAVVTDYNMGAMTGYDLIVKMRSDPTLSGLPVIVFSSEKEDGIRSSCEAMPRVRWLDKRPDQAPFNRVWSDLVVDRKA